MTNASKYEEDKQVKEYMDMHGIHNVRGGRYSNRVLTDKQLWELEQDFRHANGLCFHCGKKSHYSKDCPEKNNCQTSYCAASNDGSAIVMIVLVLALWILYSDHWRKFIW